jgi:hypothetical protein
MKSLNKVGDKLNLTAKSRAPQGKDNYLCFVFVFFFLTPSDDGEYNALIAYLATTAKQLKDMEVRVTLLNGSITKFFNDTEKLCVQEANLFGPMGVGRNGDFAAVKSGRTAHEQRYLEVQKECKKLSDEMKALQANVDERHKLGAAMEKAKKKAAAEKVCFLCFFSLTALIWQNCILFFLIFSF